MGLNARDENWRPSKSDIIHLYTLAKAIAETPRQAIADVHQTMWMKFGRLSSKDLTYSEYEWMCEVFGNDDSEQRPAESM